MIRKRTDFIVVHCSATDDGMDIGATEIGIWHRRQGWTGIGYHFVIRRDGKIEKGRDLMAVGAHAGGHQKTTAGEHADLYNEISVGVCMVGGVEADDAMKARDNFTPEQWAALKALTEVLLTMWPRAKVIGHREIAVIPKACPSFDVQAWKKRVGLSS